MKRVQFIIEQNAQRLMPHLAAIQALADTERNALGFFPAKAFEEAITRRRLIAAIVRDGDVEKLAGFLLYSGVFPNAKVQQIAATPAFRKKGAASALMKALIAELERAGFLNIRADVASDLPLALDFYAKHGFERVRDRAGGAARGRTIIIHSRQLETDNLFTLAAAQSNQLLDMAARRRNPGDIPVFAFDLNVYFDLVRQRDQSANARRLFGEALGHTVRLTVADEFVVELRKTSTGLSADPVLQMALQLPRLPKADAVELNALSSRIHEIVFVNAGHKDAGSDRAKSDAKHVAHAALSKASAFVTRDGPILNARQELLAAFGIDIATVEEVLDLLPSSQSTSSAIPIRGDGFQPKPIDAAAFAAYCAEVGVPNNVSSGFVSTEAPNASCQHIAVQCDGRTVAVGAMVLPRSVDPVARLFVHVRQEQQDAELFADYLVETLVRAACDGAAVTVELAHLTGQSIVNRLAVAGGFRRFGNAASFVKFAVGRPLTAANWAAVAQQVRRRTGLVLPDSFAAISAAGDIDIRSPKGASAKIDAASLESLLGPTVIVWPGREGVIVPIVRKYADELLGTSDHATFEFIINRDAAFLSRRGYVNSPRTAKQMRTGSPIIFYESKGKGSGRAAAVAVARIVNSVLVKKSQLEPRSDKRLVIDDAEGFSATDDVLLTTFDNLMPFPTPVRFNKLKEFAATGKANLVSAVSLSSEQITSILTCGWSGGKAR